MKYTGKRNTECGSCRGNISTPHPMVFRIDAKEHTSHLWCEKCFKRINDKYVKSMADGPNPDAVAKMLQGETGKAFVPPKGYHVTGFWLATYDGGMVGFQINFEAKDD